MKGSVYLGYWAALGGHKIGPRQVGMATTARDRFVFMQAGEDSPGLLRTHLLRYTGRGSLGLWVNADAEGGELRVQVLDSEILSSACATCGSTDSVSAKAAAFNRHSWYNLRRILFEL